MLPSPTARVGVEKPFRRTGAIRGEISTDSADNTRTEPNSCVMLAVRSTRAPEAMSVRATTPISIVCTGPNDTRAAIWVILCAFIPAGQEDQFRQP